METFFKITIYPKNGSPVTEIKRFFANYKRSQVEELTMEETQLQYGKSAIMKVDAWMLSESDPLVIEYKQKWG